MEFLTLGQMIDQIKIGMIAVPVECKSGDIEHDEYEEKYCDLAVYVDRKDYYLKTIEGHKISGILKNPFDSMKAKYILVSDKQFEKMRSSL